jgi:hypothetical protein
MLNRLAICFVAIVLCAGLLLAHRDPIMGTAVTNDTFTVTGTDNKPVTDHAEKIHEIPDEMTKLPRKPI